MTDPPDSSGTVETMVTEALTVVLTDPHRAIELVESAESQGLADFSLRWRGMGAWAKGRAASHLGRRRDGEASLSEAVTLLARSGDLESSSRAAVSLAMEFVEAGRVDEAVSLLDTALQHLSGGEAIRALVQRALALHRAGHVSESVGTWDEAINACDSLGLLMEGAVARQNRGIIRVYAGDLDGAEADLQAAAETFAALGDDIRSIEVVHNLGFAAAHRGDLPRALALFDKAQEQASQRGVLRPQGLVDRVEVTLEAGLVGEARTLSEASVGLLQKAGFDADVPEACLLAARACEEDGDSGAAARWASMAADLFEKQGRHRWRLLAVLAETMAETRTLPRSNEDASNLVGLARQLEEYGWFSHATEARVRAAEILIDNGALYQSESVVAHLVGEIYRASPSGRFQIRMVQARLALAIGDPRRAGRALISGLRALRAFQATLGSIELRSQAGGRAEELTSLAMRLSSDSARADVALWWMEAIRSTQHLGLRRPPDDAELVGLLQSLREVSELLERESLRLDEATRLRRRQAGLEELVRRKSRHAPGGLSAWPAMVDPETLSAALGDRVFVEFAIAGPRLAAVIVHAGASRIIDLGDLSTIRRTAGGLRLTLRVAASSDRPDELVQAVSDAGREAERIILQPLEIDNPAELVLSPVGPLASMPWSALPNLAGSEITIVTSAAAWLESRQRYRPVGPDAEVVLVAGPDLHHAEEEVAAIQQIWPEASVLSGTGSTVKSVAEALAGAELVHIAAHGTHRGDNPLLSGIRLSDGLLTGYELATCRKSAQLMVLSCCDTGMTETGSGIGLAQIITTTGAVSAIASVTPVSDRSAVAVMTAVHVGLASRASPTNALSAARKASGGPMGSPSSAGFVCFGYG